MKPLRTHLGPLAALLIVVSSAQSQNLSDASANTSSTSDPTAPQAVARDANSTIQQFTEFITNSLSGEILPKVHRYTEVASCLNYLDPATGQYLPSQDLVQLLSDGSAAAVQGQTKAYFAPNINTPGAIVTINGTNTLRTHIIGIFYFDSSTGSNICLSTVQDSVGELLPP